jgi:hypothetical protein
VAKVAMRELVVAAVVTAINFLYIVAKATKLDIA